MVSGLWRAFPDGSRNFRASSRNFSATSCNFSATSRNFSASSRNFSATSRNFSATSRNFYATSRKSTATLRKSTATLRKSTAIARNFTDEVSEVLTETAPSTSSRRYGARRFSVPGFCFTNPLSRLTKMPHTSETLGDAHTICYSRCQTYFVRTAKITSLKIEVDNKRQSAI
jgi:ABC-type transporter Mla subunit MlaD